MAVVAALLRLTLAVWVLIAAVVLSSAASLFMRPVVIVPPATISEAPRSLAPPGYEHERFHEYSLDKHVQAASVIAVAKYEKDGERLKCVFSEILEQAPNTEFYYTVADEYEMCSRVMKPNESYGDGQLVFFVGNPAGDALFRQLFRQSHRSRRHSDRDAAPEDPGRVALASGASGSPRSPRGRSDAPPARRAARATTSATRRTARASR
jgi:hypothetical protein